jgi:hypothetical protein
MFNTDFDSGLAAPLSPGTATLPMPCLAFADPKLCAACQWLERRDQSLPNVHI